MIDRAPWTRPAQAWALDRHVYHVECPATRNLVGLLVNDTPIWLLVTTIPNPEERTHLLTRLMQRELPDRLIDSVYDALVETWTGWPAWITERLWTEALETWQSLDARTLTNGVDLLELAPDRATTLVYGALAEHHQHDKDHGTGWDRTLRAEPLRRLRREAKQPDTSSDAKDWQAMATIFGGIKQ